MTHEQFCYWLQGRAELDTAPPTTEQWKSICEHLQTVFVKVTPPVVTTENIIKGAAALGKIKMTPELEGALKDYVDSHKAAFCTFSETGRERYC